MDTKIQADIEHAYHGPQFITFPVNMQKVLEYIGQYRDFPYVFIGDEYKLVFRDKPKEAVEYALKVRDALRYHDWRADGFDRGPAVRTAVASGLGNDPHVVAARMEPVVTPGEVWVDENTVNVVGQDFYFHPLGRKAHDDNFGERPVYRAHWSHERSAVEAGYEGPLLDEQDYRRAEALRRFAFLWLVLDQLPRGGWGRSTSSWMSEVWRGVPEIPVSPHIGDEGGFETTILNLQLLSEIAGGHSILATDIGKNALRYIADREGPRGFGTMSGSREGPVVESHARHTALVAWLFGTVLKGEAIQDFRLEKLFKHAALTLLGGPPEQVSAEFQKDRNPLLLYLATWHVATELIREKEKESKIRDWNFRDDDLDTMCQNWATHQHQLLLEAVRSNYTAGDGGPRPPLCRSTDDPINPMTVPYGQFVRMEAYTLLSSVMLCHPAMAKKEGADMGPNNWLKLQARLRAALKEIWEAYSRDFEAPEKRYTLDRMKPKARGPKAFCFTSLGGHPDLGTAAMFVRVVRNKNVVYALWGNQPPEWLNKVRYLMTEDLTELFDRYLVCPQLFALTHPGMMASILAGDDVGLRRKTEESLRAVLDHRPTSDLNEKNAPKPKTKQTDDILSEPTIEYLIETFIATDLKPERSPRIQVATASLARLLLDKLRPGRYLKEELSDAAIQSISERTLEIYREQPFVDKYDQRWGDAADREISKPFLDMLGAQAKILDVGSGPGQYAVEFAEKGHTVHLLDASSVFKDKAVARLKRITTSDPQGFVFDILDPGERKNFSGKIAGGRYDSIWCSALLVHVPTKALSDIFKWFADLLIPNGVLFTNVLIGNPRVFSRDGRYFSYLAAPDGVERMLSESGFRISFTLKKTLIENTYGEPVLDLVWVNLYARKDSSFRQPDIGTTAALLTSRAYEACADDYTHAQEGSELAASEGRRLQVDQLAQFLREKEHPKVLDAGCGPGNFVAEMARRAWHATGIDISDRMIETAQRNCPKLLGENSGYAWFQVADMRKLPDDWKRRKEEEKFDAVICVGALQHLPYDPETRSGPLREAVTEFWRVLRADGILRIDVRIGLESGYDPDLRYIQEFTDEAELLPLLEEIGFIQVGPAQPRHLSPGDNTFGRLIKISYREMWFRKSASA